MARRVRRLRNAISPIARGIVASRVAQAARIIGGIGMASGALCARGRGEAP